jgi:ABC-type lipoprotein release transport system permease subunit
LATALVVGAVISLGLALGSAVRRHRRDLAILKALGFTPGDAGRTVIWQSATTIVMGLAIGVPVGVVIGRALWSTFTTQLDVLDQPQVPLLVIAALAVGAVVTANLVAWWPARRARLSDTTPFQESE